MLKFKNPAMYLLLIPFIMEIVLETLRDYVADGILPTWIGWLFFSLLVVPILSGFVARYIRTLRDSIWMQYFPEFTMSYIGLVIMLISFNTDLIPIIGRWNISMTGLGIALVAIGLSNLGQMKQKPLLDKLSKDTDDLRSSIEKLTRKIDKIDKKITQTPSRNSKR